VFCPQKIRLDEKPTQLRHSSLPTIFERSVFFKFVIVGLSDEQAVFIRGPTIQSISGSGLIEVGPLGMGEGREEFEKFALRRYHHIHKKC